MPFIGQLTPDKGLQADQAKVRAIIDMPAPKDQAGVQRLLRMVQYLGEFLQQLLDMTKPASTRPDTEECSMDLGPNPTDSNGKCEEGSRNHAGPEILQFG